MTDADLRLWIGRYALHVREQETHLTDLDAAIGDADHGTNLCRGLDKAESALEGVAGGDLRACAKGIGMAMMTTVGGASGALLGTFWMRAAQAFPEVAEVDGRGVLAALEAGVNGIKERGKAEPDDKTMLDVWLSATEALKDALDQGQPLAAGLSVAAEAAWQEAERTVPLRARRGRASYLGERSIGHMDPGSASTALFFESGSEALGQR